jgi:hypothetical protein
MKNANFLTKIAEIVIITSTPEKGTIHFHELFCSFGLLRTYVVAFHDELSSKVVRPQPKL